MIRWRDFLNDNKLEFWPENGRHSKRTRQGWLQLESCPCCQSSGDLMGIHEESGKPVCYFCGSHSEVEVVKELLNIGWSEAYSIIKDYKESAIEEVAIKRKQSTIKRRNKTLELPPHTNLKKSGGDYLRKRGFDPKQLVDDFGVVQGAKNSEYEGRIICPIYFEGKLVSYVARDITGKKQNKYKVCKGEDEVVNHKEILDGIDDCKGEYVIVVEGRFDRMKMPLGTCVATLGAKWSQQQLNMLKQFKRVYIAFDTERQAREQGRLLASGLSIHNVDAYNIQLNGDLDIGDLSHEDCIEIVESLEG